ncbi:hypothetical protein THAOC_33814, partial [Thalassiosira oceanica]
MATSISSDKEDSGQTLESEIDGVAFKNDIESFAMRVDSREWIKSSRMAEELSLEGERLFEHLGDFYHEGVANIQRRVLASMGYASIADLTCDEQEQFVEAWYEEQLAWEMIYGDMLDGTLTRALKKLKKVMAIKNETSSIEIHGSHAPVDSHVTEKDAQDECVDEPIAIQDAHGFARDLADRGTEEIDDISTRRLGRDRFLDRAGSSSNGLYTYRHEIAAMAQPSHARRASNVEGGANSHPNTDHEMRTSRWSIDDCGVEDAKGDVLDSTYSVEQIVGKKSSAFDVELRARREALGYDQGAQLIPLGGEYREADLTTKGKAQATTPGRNQKKSKGGIKSRGSRQLTSICSSSVVSVLAALLGVFTLFGTKEMSSAFFVVAEGATSGALQSIDEFNIADEQSPLGSLSRNLRGGADPATILPEIHSAVQSQRRLLQDMYDVYEGGDRAAFDLAFKSSAGEASGEDTSLAADRPRLVDFFDPAFLIEVLANLEAIDETLGDAIESTVILRPQQLPKPDIAQTVTGRHLQNTNGAGMANDAPDMPYHPPPVCTEECAPTDTSCLCERLANCTKTMTHYDLAVLFAGGFIQNDTSSELTTSDINLFNVGDDAWTTFASILNTSRVIDTRNSSQCYAFLDQFHQSCNPLSGATCSNTNTETFQLSVDEVCEGVDTAVKLLTVPIGQVFDGYASDDGFVTNTTTCGAERVSFEVCQRFVDEFEKLYDGRNKTQFPSPNPMRTNPFVPVESDSGTIIFPISYKFSQDMEGVTELAFTEIYNEFQYCEDILVEECKDQCHLMYLHDVSGESAVDCTAACSTLMCDDTVDDQYDTCIVNECEEKYMVLPASEYKSCPAGLEIPYDECLSAAQSYTQEWISQGRGETSSNSLGGKGSWVRSITSLCYPGSKDFELTCSCIRIMSPVAAPFGGGEIHITLAMIGTMSSIQTGYDPNAQIVCKNPACVGCGYWNKKIRFLSSGTAKCLNLATRSSSDGQLLSAVDCDDSAEDFSYDGSSKQIKFKDSSGQVRCLTYGAGASVLSENLYMSSCDELTNSQWYYDKNAKALKTFSANNFCMTVDPANDEVYMSECGAIPGKGVLFIESQSDYAECPSELGLSSITSEGHCQFALSSLLDSPTLVDMNNGSWDYTPCGCFVWDSDGIYYDFEECADDMDPVASEKAKLACIKENISLQSIHIPNLWMPEISMTGLYQQVRVNYDVTLCMTVEDQNEEGTNCILNIAEAGGKCVWMKDCVGNTDTVPGQTSNNQAFYFDPSTYAIRTFENYCLEYDTGTGVNNTNQQEANLYASPSCTGATNQQFFYDMPSGAIKTFYDDKCIDMDY